MGKRKVQRLAIDLHGLAGGRPELFRISKTQKKDPAIDRWLSVDSELRSIAKEWFAQMRACGPDVREAMHDGCPVACVADAPFGYVNTFKHHVNVGFFTGADLPDPAGLLEGSGKRMRHVKLRPDQPVNTAALSALIAAAYKDVKKKWSEEK